MLINRFLRTFFTGVFIGICCIPPFALVGCTPSAETTAARDQARAHAESLKHQVDAKTKSTVAQATSNLDAVGGALETTGRVPEGQAVKLQSNVIDDALGITEAEKPMAKVSQAEWEAIKGDLSKANGALAALQTQAAQAKADLEAARAEAQAAAEQAATWQKKYEEESAAFSKGKVAAVITTVAGIGLTAARMMGVPGVGLLTDPLIRLVGRSIIQPLETKAAELTTQASTAATAVIASDLGRSALAKLDHALASAGGSSNPRTAGAVEVLRTVITQATGGQASTLDGLFKHVAKGAAVDAEQAAEVSSYLTTLRSKEIETELGQPVALKSLNFTA